MIHAADDLAIHSTP